MRAQKDHQDLTSIWSNSYTCKARHASCDEKKPVCSNCERLSLQCRPFEPFIVRSAYFPTAGDQPIAEASSSATSHTAGNDSDSTAASVRPDTSTSTSSIPSDSPLLVSPPLAAFAPARTAPLSINNEVAHLLSVYATGVATWMDIFDHSHSYQLEVPRRCLTSLLLTRCVCAFTAKQLSLLPAGGIWSLPAARYYGSALRLLIQHLDSSPGSTQGDALTANMLLSSYEMLEAHGHEHQRHLRGASTLIRMQGINAQSYLGIDRANFWVYVRHEITIALESESALQLKPRDWNVGWRPGETDEGMLGNQVIWLVARVIDVIYAPESPSSPSSVLQEILNEAVSWVQNLPASFQGVKYGDTDDLGLAKTYFAVPSAAAAMMWYHLLLILLCAEAAQPRHDPSQKKTQTQYHAAEIASIALSELPPSVRAFSAQPLFLAAKHINGIAKKTKLWALLADVEARCGLNSRSHVQKLQRLAESSSPC